MHMHTHPLPWPLQQQKGTHPCWRRCARSARALHAPHLHGGGAPRSRRQLLGIFGNTIHLNDGTHLDGGIGATEDAKWQRLYNLVTACSLPLYNLPNSRWAHRFLMTLTDLWIRVIQRCWNSERPLVFQAVILHRVRGIT
jgi:hypothetical protein